MAMLVTMNMLRINIKKTKDYNNILDYMSKYRHHSRIDSERIWEGLCNGLRRKIFSTSTKLMITFASRLHLKNIL